MMTHMRREALQAPDCVARLLEAEAETVSALAQAIRTGHAGPWLTVARGSSDCAAAYFATAMALLNGRIVSSLPPSLVTVYGARLILDNACLVAFSQSGQSPDLLAVVENLHAGRGRTVAFVNDMDSPLARLVGCAVPLHAWPETAVAATKSVIAEFVGGAFLAAELAGPGTLRQAFAELPSQLRAAMQGDNSSVAQSLADAANLFVIGRGLGLSVAQEIALKFKETCGIHAEALSSAELRHGPMALLDEQSHALLLTLAGPGETELLDCAGFLRTQGVTVQTVGHQASASLTLPPTSGYVLNPVCALAALYPVVDEVALLRHRNPDAPLRIQKVTLTL